MQQFYETCTLQFILNIAINIKQDNIQTATNINCFMLDRLLKITLLPKNHYKFGHSAGEEKLRIRIRNN